MIVLAILTLVATIGLVFVVLPRVIFPIRDVPGTFLDRGVAGFVAMTALSVGALYLLALFGMMEILALGVVWLGAWWFLKGRHSRRGRLSNLAYSFFAFSDLAENKGMSGAASEMSGDARGRAGHRMHRFARNARDTLTDPGSMLTLVALALVIGVSAYLRFRRSITNIELVPQDSYLALFATKSITAGNLLEEGIYPQGTYLWMSLLDRFYVLDTYTFVRFAGPMMNVLELLGLYWAVSRTTRSRAAGVLSAAVLGLFAGHPLLLMDWGRQIGAMTQEFSVAFALVALVYGAQVMATARVSNDIETPTERTWHLWLMAGALFLAVTSHTMAVLVCAIGFAAILGAGVITASWTVPSFKRFVIAGAAATVAGHIFIPIGMLRGQSFARSYFQYSPTNAAGFGGAASSAPATVGHSLANNILFQLAVVGCVAAIVLGLVVALRGALNGRRLLGIAAGALGLLLFYDVVATRFELLFRVRVSYAAGAMIAVGFGLGIGALAVAASELTGVREGLWERYRGSQRAARSGIEAVALLITCLVLLAMWPLQSSQALNRTQGESGYPQATQVALDIIRSEPRLTYTFVGASEQYQEGFANGWHVESWVFAKDIVFSDARDPAYELPIPTDVVYVFVEKEAFDGPQAPWTGATEEYYRTTEKRRRIMERIGAWTEEYRRFHTGTEIHYEDSELRVYRIERKVNLDRALRTNQFKDYSYQQGDWFDDDGDVTANEVTPNLSAPNERQDVRGQL